MFWTILGNALLIFSLRIIDVSMGTIRAILVVRNISKWAALVGFFEVTVWVLAVGKVVAGIDNFWSVIAYSGGFASGTLLGLWIEGKLAFGFVEVMIISREKTGEILQSIHDAGYGATQFLAEGYAGVVSPIYIITPRKELKRIFQIVMHIDADSFLTIDDLRHVSRGYQRLGK